MSAKRKERTIDEAVNGISYIEYLIPVAQEFKWLYRLYYQKAGEMDKQTGQWRFGLIMDALTFGCSAYLWETHRDGRFSLEKLRSFFAYIKANNYKELVPFLYAVSDRLEGHKPNVPEPLEEVAYSVRIYDALIHTIGVFLGRHGLRALPTETVNKLVGAFESLSQRIRQVKFSKTVWPDSVDVMFKFACNPDNWINYGDRRITEKNVNAVIRALHPCDDETLLMPFMLMSGKLRATDDRRHAYNVIISTLLNSQWGYHPKDKRGK